MNSNQAEMDSDETTSSPAPTARAGAETELVILRGKWQSIHYAIQKIAC